MKTAAEQRNGRGPELGEAAERVARGLRRASLSPGAIGWVARGLDAAAVALVFWFAGFFAAEGLGAGAAAARAGAAALVGVAVVAAAGGYRPAALRRLAPGWAVLVAAGAAVAAGGVMLGAWAPAGFLAAAVAGIALAVLPGRALAAAVAAWALDCGLTERRAVVVGGGAEAERLIRGLAANPENDIRICGMFDDRDDARSPPVVIGTPKLGTVRELVAFARVAEIDLLIVTLPLSAERRIRQILDVVRVLPVDVRLSAYSADCSFPRREDAAEFITVLRRPLGGSRWLRKRALDLVVAAAALLLLAPVMIATAVAIRAESRGPVLFRQMRHGYNNRPVAVWKFRSMHAGACDATARQPVTRGDPRVTRVGRVIRRWSVDELPQLFNVLSGDLSLVGPRPHVVGAVSSSRRAFEEIVVGYAARHRVPPGLTGWAQIHGWRGEIDDPAKLRARVEHDLWYIENWSIRLDLYILAVTPIRLVDKRGAY